MTNRSDDRAVHHHHYSSCCWPGSDGIGGTLFWGAALIILGGVWLVANVTGLDNWGEWLVPALFVGWGVALLINITPARTGLRDSVGRPMSESSGALVASRSRAAGHRVTVAYRSVQEHLIVRPRRDDPLR